MTIYYFARARNGCSASAVKTTESFFFFFFFLSTTTFEVRRRCSGTKRIQECIQKNQKSKDKVNSRSWHQKKKKREKPKKKIRSFEFLKI